MDSLSVWLKDHVFAIQLIPYWISIADVLVANNSETATDWPRTLPHALACRTMLGLLSSIH